MSVLRHVLELFELTLPFQLSSRHRFLCNLSNKALFELEEAPFFGQRLVTAIQSHQEEIGQHGQRHRVAHVLGFLGHLRLAQVQPAFELLNRYLYPQRLAYILRMVPALASVRLVTRIYTPFGLWLCRFLDNTITPL